MNRVYGRIPDLVLLPPVEDRLPPEKAIRESSKNRSEFTMLFVGSAFPPNLEGVRWFVREVMPFVHERFLLSAMDSKITGLSLSARMFESLEAFRI